MGARLGRRDLHWTFLFLVATDISSAQAWPPPSRRGGGSFWRDNDFSAIWHRAERARVAAAIQEITDRFAKEVSKEAEESVPHTLRVEWVAQQDIDSYIQRDKLIVRMNYHTNEQRNLVAATMAYVAQGVVPHARRHLAVDVSKALDFEVAKRVLSTADGPNALDFFYREVVEQDLAENEAVRRYFVTMDALDDMGYFTRILLREFVLLGRRLLSAVPRNEIAEETRRFVEFLDRLVTREPGEDVDPTFVGSVIKMSLVLVARHQTLSSKGYGPYISWIRKCCRGGILSVYLAGRGRNVGPVKGIAKVCEEQGLLKVGVIHEYRASRATGAKNAICVVSTPVTAQEVRAA